MLKSISNFVFCFFIFLSSLSALSIKNWSGYGEKDFVGKKLPLELPSGKKVVISINSEKIIGGRHLYLGRVVNVANSLFEAQWSKGELQAKLQFVATKEAYSISQTKNGSLDIVALNSELEFCEKHSITPSESFVAGAQSAPPAIPQNVNVRTLQSNPGATGVIYLHLNGATIPANSYWSNAYNSGHAFSVLATTLSDQAIYNIWLAIKEDFSPFQLNVTTDSSVYNAQSVGNRFRLIITPTSNKFANLSNTGVAPIGGYSNDYDAFCFPSGFPFETDAYMLGEVCSHEIGHAVGLRHDGGMGTNYYAGHGSSIKKVRLWGPIMGDTYRTQVSQWSKGEYSGANNIEDDLSIISKNNFGYKLDDHADDIATATVLGVSASDMVVASNTGVIEKNTDVDMFSFTTTGGQVDLSFKPASYKPNLKIQVELLDSLGSLISTHVRTDGELDASLSKQLSGGRYYLKIDGVGYLTANTGYSDYGSLGEFSIEGGYPTNGAIVVISSSLQSSSSQSISSSSAGIDCSSYPTWQNRSYDWSAAKEYVVYQGSLYSHTSWASNSVPDQNTSWVLENVCRAATSSSSLSSVAVSSSNGVSSSSVSSSSVKISSSVAISSSVNLSSSNVLSSSVQNALSSSIVGLSSSDATTSIRNYQITWNGNTLRFDNSSNLEVEVYSLQGHKQKVILEQSGNSIQLNLNQLSMGLWIVRTQQEGKVNLHKVLRP